MPTYEYECMDRQCKNRFELLQSIKALPQTKCPKCHGNARRLISKGVGIIFKGTGFYETDYKQKKENKETSAPKECPMKNESCKDCKKGKE